ncbi:hypothetical protein [Aurantimonas coralicida]|uniref:hypothetical protein n=1 Tax=Aurantimonas coralicida TaxID=182270 RepID=UPI001E524F24|nr:hypothetical protein [Aurantimonas coralicida]MCD1645653.1 hypothetical protein [Aurantimonas coralicida]
MNQKKLRHVYRKEKLVRRHDGRKQALGTRSFPIAPTAASGTNDSITRCSRRSQSVRRAIILWKEDYNHHGSYSALENLLPARFATKSTLEDPVGRMRPEMKPRTLPRTKAVQGL